MQNINVESLINLIRFVVSKAFILLQNFPFIILIIVLIFRKEIASKISDMCHANIAGNSVDFQKKAQDNVQKKDPNENPDALTKLIAGDVEKAKEEYLKLYKHLHYERTFNMIYGTQIMLLEKLEKSVPQGQPFANLRIFWLESCRLLKNDNYTYDKYMDFLKNALLINYKDADVVLSTGGKDFLNYIRNQYPTVYASKPW